MIPTAAPRATTAARFEAKVKFAFPGLDRVDGPFTASMHPARSEHRADAIAHRSKRG
jgi:hypothetical protein